MDYDCETGFARVAKHLLEQFKAIHGGNVIITIIALNNDKEDSYWIADNSKFPKIQVVPAHLTAHEKDIEAQDPYFRHGLLQTISAANWDAIFILQDLEVMNPTLPALKLIRKQKKAKKQHLKIVSYFPIDSTPYKSDVNVINEYSRAFTYTDYGKEVISPYLLKSTKAKLRVAPHGTNMDEFFRVDRKIAKIFREERFGDVDFLIGNVNRNQSRKDIPTTLLGFKLFKKQLSKYDPKLKTALYLHMNPLDPMGNNLLRICEMLGLEVDKDVIFPVEYKTTSEQHTIPTKVLNLIYNSLDVYLTTTTAEGWGLTVTEAMAAYVPVIAPIHTSLTEITNDGKLVEPLRDLSPTFFHKDAEKLRFQCSPPDVANALFKTFSENNKMKLAKRTKAAQDKIKGTYIWEATAKRIANALEQVS